MRHELESLPDRINRLERQLRLFEIAAAVLAVLAIAFALAPRPSAQQPGAVRVRQLIVEDATSLRTPPVIRRYGLAEEEFLRPQAR